jgi:hypothetical protein
LKASPPVAKSDRSKSDTGLNGNSNRSKSVHRTGLSLVTSQHQNGSDSSEVTSEVTNEVTKGEGEGPNPYTRTVAHWFTTYEKHYGTKPVYRAKEGLQLKQLLKQLGEVELCTRITNAFTHEWCRNGVTLGVIVGSPNAFRAAAGATPPESPETIARRDANELRNITDNANRGVYGEKAQRAVEEGRFDARYFRDQARAKGVAL